VRGIVSRGRDPLAVDDAEIASLRAVLATGRPVEVCPYLRAGEAVRIAAGPLAGVRGVILRARGHWRVVVGVEALGSSVSVEVDACQLLPDRNPPAALPTIPQRGAHAHYQA
jgi:transcription antitermination factor NusG